MKELLSYRERMMVLHRTDKQMNILPEVVKGALQKGSHSKKGIFVPKKNVSHSAEQRQEYNQSIF